MNRRKFFQIAGLSTMMVNGFPMRPFANTKIARALTGCEEIEDRVLILIQLKGGNDGLNTVIPINQYDEYEALRPVIKVPDSGPEKYINLDNGLSAADKVGLHPVMTGFKSLYDEGLLRIVQAVGYENINQSHFKGSDLWLSGGDSTPENSNLQTGWMGRALQAMFPDVKGTPIPDMLYPLGIQVGDPNPSLGFHTSTEHQNVINLYGQDPDGFYSLVQTIGGAPLLNVPNSEYGVEIDYIMGVERSVDQYSEYITQAFQAGSNSSTVYPQNGLAYQLKTIARLIKGGCKTKIYLCSMGGFDTHGRQIAPEGTVLLGGHAGLLRTLSDSVKSFFDDLKGLSLDDKVMACTFSEFGRTARENGGGGTDHGTLAPMFVIGKPASAGVAGTNSDLTNLTDDDQLQGQQYDYRQVFGTLLQDWLGGGGTVMEEAMFDGYEKLPIIDSSFVVTPDCYLGGGVTSVKGGNLTRQMQVSPNPATTHTEVSLRSDKAYTARLTLHTTGGRLAFGSTVQVQQGLNLFYLQLGHLPPATYFVRLEHGMSGAGEVVKLVVTR